MKFSCSVEIMSALSTRMLVAANPSARAMVGRAIDLKCSAGLCPKFT